MLKNDDKKLIRPAAVARMALYLPSTRTSKEATWVTETKWGVARVKGNICQTHNLIIGLISRSAHKRRLNDGRLELLVDMNKVASMYPSKTNVKFLMDKLVDVKRTSIEFFDSISELDEKPYKKLSGILDEIEETNIEVDIKQNSGHENLINKKVKRHYYKITFSKFYSQFLLNTRVSIGTKEGLMLIDQLKNGVLISIVNFLLTHDIQSRYSLSTVLQIVVPQGFEIRKQRKYELENAIKNNKENLSKLGIEFDEEGEVFSFAGSKHFSSSSNHDYNQLKDRGII